MVFRSVKDAPVVAKKNNQDASEEKVGKGKGVSGGNMTSYSGGGAVAGYSGAMATTSAMNINVTGRISGSDIVLSYDKTKDNKSNKCAKGLLSRIT